MVEFTFDSSPPVGNKPMPSGDSGELAGQAPLGRDGAGEPFADALRESMDDGEADDADNQAAEKASLPDAGDATQAAFLPLSVPVEETGGQPLPIAAILVPSSPAGQSPGFGDDGMPSEESLPEPESPRSLMTTLAVALKAQFSAPTEPSAVDDPAASAFDSLLADLPPASDEPLLLPRGFDGALPDTRLAAAGVDASRVPSSSALSTRVDTPLGQSGWGDAFAEKISWLVGKQVQQASIHVTPEHLGPIEVRLHASQDQLSVTIAAQHVTTQETLAATMSRLREALAGTSFSQIDLQMANPGFAQADQSGQQAAGGGQAGDGGRTGGQAGLAPDGGPDVVRIETRGLLDDYA